MNPTSAFLRQLDAIIEQNKMLDHPFYQAWSMGTLTIEALREYAKQYDRFVQAFPTLLSATHANTPHLAVRQELLENLIEEERGAGNHPGLWREFSMAVGVNSSEIENAPLLPETQRCIDTLKDIARNRPYLAGVAALYAYESQIPQVAKVKIEGLRKHYGIDDANALSFFTVHQEADVHHSAGERKILEEHALTEAEQRACLEAAQDATRAMLALLDGVYLRYVEPIVN